MNAPKLEEKYLLQNYHRYPLVIDSGQGCYVTDTNGKRYLDLIAGIGVNALGYSHPRIVAALTDQAALCIHTSNLVYHRYQGPLAERLCHLSRMDRAFFANSGTEAMEAALKAVRGYWHTRAPQRTQVVALHKSFHGRTLGSLAITGQPSLRESFEPLNADVTFVDPSALHQVINENTAAVVVEPVQGEGGVNLIEEETLCAVRELTRQVGALLIADETQCGLGRTGRPFAYQWAGIRPDIVVTAKPLAAGLPLGATLFTETVAQSLPAHSHGSTFGGGPLACRVALEFLSILDGLLPQITSRGEQLRQGLEDLKQRHPAIVDIRSKGMMLGIELDRPGHSLVLAALDRGLLINCTQNNVLRLLPPYILTSEEASIALEILDEVLP